MGYITWVIFALIIGCAGQQRRIGFLGAFLISLFLSPLAGLLIIVISPKKDQYKYDN